MRDFPVRVCPVRVRLVRVRLVQGCRARVHPVPVHPVRGCRAQVFQVRGLRPHLRRLRLNRQRRECWIQGPPRLPFPDRALADRRATRLGRRHPPWGCRCPRARSLEIQPPRQRLPRLSSRHRSWTPKRSGFGLLHPRPRRLRPQDRRPLPLAPASEVGAGRMHGRPSWPRN